MMFRRKRGWIGIDFGDRALKVAQVVREAGRMRIAHSALMWRPAGTAQGGGGADRSGWSSQDIAAALALDFGLSGRQAACMLPMECSELCAVSIPPGSPEERRATVADELAQRYPDDAATRAFVYWDCPVPASQGAGPRENTLVLTAPRELVTGMAEQLAEARLACQVMDGPPFVLARAAAMAFPGSTDEAVGVVEWGYSSSTFCISRQGYPQYTRHLRNCGAGQLVEAVGHALNLREDESIELVFGCGLDGAGPGGRDEQVTAILAEIATPVFGSLAEEIRKTLTYVEMQYPDLLPSWLCLLGDGATVDGAARALSENLEMPVRLWQMASEGMAQHPSHAAPQPLLAAAAALSVLAWTS
ncbi:MAG TPA: hypothetical protein EYP56_10695 [Planctomycetaceae bacterium]|nr:hypothetical protein [Planctomycetaceae bacterium]